MAAITGRGASRRCHCTATSGCTWAGDVKRTTATRFPTAGGVQRTRSSSTRHAVLASSSRVTRGSASAAAADVLSTRRARASRTGPSRRRRGAFTSGTRRFTAPLGAPAASGTANPVAPRSPNAPTAASHGFPVAGEHGLLNAGLGLRRVVVDDQAGAIESTDPPVEDGHRAGREPGRPVRTASGRAPGAPRLRRVHRGCAGRARRRRGRRRPCGGRRDRPRAVERARSQVRPARSSLARSADCSLSFTSSTQSSGRSPTASAKARNASMSSVSAWAPGRLPAACVEK